MASRIGTIEIRVTQEERSAIRAAAKADNRTVSDWVRLTLLRTIIPGEPMKLTVNQIHEATLTISQIIREQRSMPQIGHFRLARLHARLLPEYKIIEERRDALIREHGTLVDGETDQWKVEPQNMAAFNADWAEIADDEIEIDVQPVSIANLDNITASELVVMGELITE